MARNARGALALALLGGLGCDAGIPLEVPQGVVESTIGDLIAGSPEREDERVRLPVVVILAEDTFDESGSGRTGTAYMVDPGNLPGHGFQAFAPTVQLGAGEFLAPGDLVRVTGTFVRFRGPGCPADCDCTGRASCFCFNDVSICDRQLPQLNIGAVIERIGFWQDATPIELTLAEYQANPAQYVGNLITLRGLVAMETYQPAGGGTRLDPFQTTSSVRVGADLYRIPGIIPGTGIRRLTGVASYFFDDFVMPRSASDVELDGSTPTAEDTAAACADGVDNDGDGPIDCEDSDCCGQTRCQTLVLTEVAPNPTGPDMDQEWVELLNPTTYATAASCLSLGRGDGTWSPLAGLAGVIPAGGCIVVGAGPPMPAVTVRFAPELANGGTPGVGVGLFAGAPASISATSLPVDGVIYGDDNASMLRIGGTTPTTSHVGTPAEGQTLSRTTLIPATWIAAAPTPGDCAHAM